MNIHNVRLGFATNSSSSHSFIILNPDVKARDEQVYGGEFGWQDFTAITEEAKLTYLGVALRDALAAKHTPPEIVNLILNEFAVAVNDGAYIDHQSFLHMPRAFGSEFPHIGFLKAFRKWLLDPRVAILGGNDNDGEYHALKGRGEIVKFPFVDEPSMIVRQDGKHWTLYNQNTGAKVRFSFDPHAPKPARASTPELVDIKITDYCPYDCPFCYQDSTAQGKPASYERVANLFSYLLRDLQVFEVALGGGEPTLHPDFINILKAARENGIIPNFTTRNLAWLNDPYEREQILEYAGTFAYSADDHFKIQKLGEAVEYFDMRPPNVHIVMGTVDQFTFRYMLETCAEYSLPVTLLGYKTTGRGALVKPKSYVWWINEVQSLAADRKYVRLSIDTAIAAEYEDALEKAGVPDWMYHTREGAFSCYIDMVKETVAASSYEGDGVPFKLYEPDDFRRIFATFGGDE